MEGSRLNSRQFQQHTHIYMNTLYIHSYYICYRIYTNLQKLYCQLKHAPIIVLWENKVFSVGTLLTPPAFNHTSASLQRDCIVNFQPGIPTGREKQYSIQKCRYIGCRYKNRSKDIM